MSEKDQKMVELLQKLPEKIQDRFLDQAQGAAMVIEMQKEADNKTA